MILLTSHYDLQLPRYEEHGALRIYRTGKGRKQFLYSAFFAGRKILQQDTIDLIHTSTYGGAIPAALLAWWYRKKILITVHEIFAKLWYRYKVRYHAVFFRFFEFLIFQLPYDSYHCVSLYTLNALRLCYPVPDHKLILIPNGVDRSFRNPSALTALECPHICQDF